MKSYRVKINSYMHARTYTIYYTLLPGDIRHTMLDSYLATKKRVEQLRKEGFTILQISRITYEEIFL